MAVQWLRYCRLLVTVDGSQTEAIDFSDFRIKFRISQDVVGKPAFADIKVYNLSESTINRIKTPTNQAVSQHNIRVILDAGYEENHYTIFEGDLWWKCTGKESNTDSYLQLLASAGDNAHQYAVVNASIPRGADQRKVFDTVMQSMREKGVDCTKVPSLMTMKLPRGKVVYSTASDAMASLGDSNGFYWGYSPDGIRTVPKDRTATDGETAIVLSPSTGMIDLPTLTPDGVSVQTLLNPQFRIGSHVQIDDDYLDIASGGSDLESAMKTGTETMAMKSRTGIYYAVSVIHEGDTRGTEWYTSLSLLAMSSKAPIQPQVFNTMGGG